MKAKSTIEKKERETRRAILEIEGRWEKGKGLDEWESKRHDCLYDYWRALCWVLGKDDDEP